jgi:hypothetical protein
MVTSTRRHAKYPHQLSHYAEAYGRSVEGISRWIKLGKKSGWLPPLDNSSALRDWYERHIGALPDDLATKFCTVLPASAEAGRAATNGEKSDDERAQTERAAPVPLLDLEQAILEMRAILATDIAELKRSSNSDSRRGVLLRHVQKTADSLCKLENTLSARHRDRRDALPWNVFESAIGDILLRLVDIRRGMPHRIMSEIETAWVSKRKHRCARVVRWLREPLSAAVEKVCEQDVLVLVSCPELRPVYEQYRQAQIASQYPDAAVLRGRTS